MDTDRATNQDDTLEGLGQVDDHDMRTRSLTSSVFSFFVSVSVTTCPAGFMVSRIRSWLSSSNLAGVRVSEV